MKKFIVLLFPLLTMACASGPCRSHGTPVEVQSNQTTDGNSLTKPTASAVAPAAAANVPATSASRVKVYKADGSLQCGQGKTIDLKVMEAQLKKAGVKVHSSAKQPDGMMHTQVCGAATGTANAFEIDSANMPKAEKLGFRQVEVN